jgi:hypothetical protein
MKDEISERLQDQAWKYFSLHADQRLKTFNFYLILATIIVGGLLTVMKDLKTAYIGAILAFTLTLLSFVFWKLDQRTRQMIWYAEEALKWCETEMQLPQENFCPHVASIFRREEHLTKHARRPQRLNIFVRHFSYSECFSLIFFVFGLGGFVLGLWLLFQ